MDSLEIWAKYFSMENLIHWLTVYKYAVLFPLAIIEGPVLAVVAGWLCATGLLRIEAAYPIIIAGDMVGDSGCYLLGRVTKAGHMNRFLRWLGCTDDKVNRIRHWFRANPVKMISLSKITPGVGPAGIFLAGQSRIPYKEFLPVCIGTSALQYFFYLQAGLLVGHGYLLLTRYLNVAASLCIGLAIAI